MAEHQPPGALQRFLQHLPGVADLVLYFSGRLALALGLVAWFGSGPGIAALGAVLILDSYLRR